jgi:hypothetical protein
MKLRLRGNSLRLRLTQTEVISLRDTGGWRTSTALGPDGGAGLAYAVEAVAAGPVGVSLGQESGGLSVVVQWPAAEVRRWADSASVGMYHETAWGLKIAVEKDFRCLDPSRDEDESDNFENPNAEDGHHHGAACGQED